MPGERSDQVAELRGRGADRRPRGRDPGDGKPEDGPETVLAGEERRHAKRATVTAALGAHAQVSATPTPAATLASSIVLRARAPSPRAAHWFPAR